MLLLGIFGESQDSVMQITPTKLSSAICCISSTFLANYLTLADNIVGISSDLGSLSFGRLRKTPKLTVLLRESPVDTTSTRHDPKREPHYQSIWDY